MVPCLRTINYSGTWCDDCYSIPRRPTTLIRWKVLDLQADEVLEVLSILDVLPAIQNVMRYPQE
jgi:hypothetical protein